MRRTPLKRGKELRSVKGLARGKPLERKTPLRRSGRWNRGDWEQHTRLMAAAHAAWKQKVTHARCAVCVAQGRKPEQDCSKQRDPHHILPARYIRRYVRALRLPKDEAASLLRSLLYDTRNGMCLGRRHHDKHETAKERVPQELIPRKAWQFAGELGLEHVLERLYPE